MNWRRFLLITVAAGLALTGHLHAQTTFIWTGGYGSNFHDSRNWLGGEAPVGNGTEVVRFGPTASNYVYWESTALAGLEFVGHRQSYFISSAALDLGAQGLVFAPAGPVSEYDFTQISTSIYLAANQTWDIQSGRLAIFQPLSNAPESGPFHLTKTGAGTLDLGSSIGGNSSWSGGLTVRDGRVMIHPAVDLQGSPIPTNSLGTGTVTFDSTQGGTPTLVSSDWVTNYQNQSSFGGVDVILPNAVAINGTLRLENHSELTLIGGVTLLANATLALHGDPLFIASPITEQGTGRKLTIDGFGLVVLDPQSQAGGGTVPLNTYSGGTHVQNGALVFGSGAALPANGFLSMSATGYIGYASTSGVATYLAKFDPAGAFGTIGFDTDPDGATTNIFENAINLTGLPSSVRLGSVTQAYLAGLITPAGTHYRFGGGGGTLAVSSALTNGESARGVVMDSTGSLPLTVWLTNADNSFTGGVTATHGALIFTAGALPGGAGLTLGTGGYLGTTATFASGGDYAAYLARFAGQGVIGFDIDAFAVTPRTISHALTLPAGFHLGTASRLGSEETGFTAGLIINGALTGATVGNNEVFRFAAFKGGYLEVASNLTNSAGQVYIGDPNSLGTFGDPIREEISTVSLTGDNSYAGTTTLYTGHLVVGQSNAGYGTNPTTALGTGALLIQPHNITIPGDDHDDLFPLLSVASPSGESAGPMIIGNAIVLNNSLGLGGDNDMTLAGTISGPGGLVIGEDTNYGLTVRLSGNNTFSGGVYVDGSSSVIFGSDTAAGTGRLSFGNSSGGSASFESANPVIHGLESNQYANIYFDPGTTLTINQTDHTTFRGQIGQDNRLEITGPGGGVALTTDVVKTGSGSIRFTNSIYADNFYLNEGTVIAGNEGEGNYRIFGNTTHLQGGALLLQNVTYGSGLVLTSGTLGGSGSFQPFDNAAPVIGSGLVLSPGSAWESGIGTLQFTELNLASLGTYVWNLRGITGQNPADAAHDYIYVSSPTTLTISATSENPFVIQAVTLDSSGVNGLLGGFVEGQSYSWSLLSYAGLAGVSQHFNPTNVALDLSLFQTNLAGYASLEFTNLTGPGNVMLHFTAVPEPSTYALLALGLGFVGFTLRRRRRAD